MTMNGVLRESGISGAINTDVSISGTYNTTNDKVLSGFMSESGISGSLNSKKNLNGSIGAARNVYVKEIEFNNRYEFPSMGKADMLYVAKNEHKLYIFNSDTLNYEVVGSDYTEIEIIQGTL